MKVKLITECVGPNPLYDPAEAYEAAGRGEPYDQPPKITLVVGTEIEHPEAWRHCVIQPGNKSPRAIPVDDAAKAATKAANARFEERLNQMRMILSSLKLQLKTDADGNLVARSEAEDRFLESAVAYGLLTLKPKKKK